MDANEAVVIFTTNNPADAVMRKNLLLGEGIKCEVDSTNQGGFLGLVDVHLLVHAWDEARARRLFAERQGAPGPARLNAEDG